MWVVSGGVRSLLACGDVWAAWQRPGEFQDHVHPRKARRELADKDTRLFSADNDHDKIGQNICARLILLWTFVDHLGLISS